MPAIARPDPMNASTPAPATAMARLSRTTDRLTCESPSTKAAPTAITTSRMLPVIEPPVRGR